MSQNSFNTPGVVASTATSSESFTDTNNALFPFVEPRFLPSHLPPLEYGIGSIFNEIGTSTEPAFAGSSYDIINIYNEGVGPTWQLPDVSTAGYWDHLDDLV
jgi:hypothetical protein